MQEIDGRIGSLRYYIDIYEDCYVVDAAFPLRVDWNDGNVMAAMAELICRINKNLVNGKFLIDYESGKIVYVICMGYYDNPPHTSTIEKSLLIPQWVFEDYCEGILAIMFNNMSAEDAFKMCEESLEKDKEGRCISRRLRHRCKRMYTQFKV